MYLQHLLSACHQSGAVKMEVAFAPISGATVHMTVLMALMNSIAVHDYAVVVTEYFCQILLSLTMFLKAVNVQRTKTSFSVFVLLLFYYLSIIYLFIFLISGRGNLPNR